MNVLRTRVIYVSTSSILCAFVQGKLSTSTFRLIISSITFNCILDAFHKLLILLAMIFLQMSNKVSCIVRLCCFSSPRNSVFAFFALGEFCIFCQSKKLPNNRFSPRHYGHRRQERKTKGTGVLNFVVCQQHSHTTVPEVRFHWFIVPRKLLAACGTSCVVNYIDGRDALHKEAFHSFNLNNLRQPAEQRLL